ncbi:MAG TPA: hypothetical protein VFX50_02565 [Gemmatimonadales bacterium]|nr:hypothetical protein [Gemmatimonadales bacterium]
MSLARDLIGRGGWMAWHLFTLAWIAPLALSVKLALGLVPGAGPQGGEAIFLLMILSVFALAFCSIVNAMLWLATKGPTDIGGKLRRFGTLMVAVVVGITLWFWLLVRATSPESTDVVAWAGVIALLAATVAFNLWALVQRSRAVRS